jgi:mannitol/fructose-specific phosphotransferase system IIA component (Ntr-type)
MILKEIIEFKSLEKSNFIQQILILILLQIKGNNQITLNELIEKNQVNYLIKILEKIKSKNNELQTDFSNFITDSKINMNIDDLIKEIEFQ